MGKWSLYTYYNTSAVIHQHNFVDPLDDEVHTQNVQNMWMQAKCNVGNHFSLSLCSIGGGNNYVHIAFTLIRIPHYDVIMKNTN